MLRGGAVDACPIRSLAEVRQTAAGQSPEEISLTNRLAVERAQAHVCSPAKRLMRISAATVALALAGWLALAATAPSARAAHPRLGVVYDCAFPTFLGDDYEQGGIVFRSRGRFRYGTEVKHKRLAGKIRRGKYKVKGTFYDLPAIQFLTGPKILRPDREDGAKSFFDPARPTYVGIWAASAIDLPWDCYQVGSKDWREREKEQRESRN
jgi:hypothetical protein